MHTLKAIFLIFIIIGIGFGCDNYNNLTPDQLAQKGQQLYQQGKFDDAVKLYKRAIQLKPATTELHFKLGIMCYDEWQRSLDQAQKKILEDMIVGGKKYDAADNDKLLLRKGYRPELLGLALSEFNEVLKYDPSNWKARYHIAVDLFNNKKYDDAIVQFKKIIQLQPGYPNSYSIMGKAYLETGQYQLAIRALEKAVELDPGAENYYQLGMAYKRINNRKKVEAISQKLKKLDISRYRRLLDPLN
jgi:tetratricopeptide (TPR) repeat protein